MKMKMKMMKNFKNLLIEVSVFVVLSH